jgi:hypothetical protein
VLAADAVLLGTPANIGYMSGALKHFFDVVYYPILDDTRGLPYGLYVHGNLDTAGAITAVETIAGGLGLAAGGRAGRGARPARTRQPGPAVAELAATLGRHRHARLTRSWPVGAGLTCGMARPKVHDEKLRARLLERAGHARLGRRTRRAEPAHPRPRLRDVDHRRLRALRRQERAAHGAVRRGVRAPGAADRRAHPERGPAGGPRAHRPRLPRERARRPAPVRAHVLRPTLLSAEAARRTVAGTALGPLRAAALRAVEEKALRPDTDTALVSLTLWTTVHGWVALQLRGYLPPNADDRCDDAVRAVLAGWA